MANESLVFDILARDGASASIDKVARAAGEASGTLQEMSDKLHEVGGRVTADIKVDDKEAQAQVDSLLAKIAVLDKRLKSGRLDVAGVARAKADISGIDLAVDRLNDKLKKARDGGGGFFSKLGGLLGLFGGAGGSAGPAAAGGGASLGPYGIAAAIAAAIPLVPALAGGAVGGGLGAGALFGDYKEHPKQFAGLTTGIRAALAEAFSGLGGIVKPLATQFGTFIKSLGQPLDQLSKAAIPDFGAFFKGLEPSLRQIIPLFTQLAKSALPIMTSLGRSFGLIAVDAVKMLVKLEPVFKTSAHYFSDLAKIVGDALKDAGSFMAGFTRDTGQWITILRSLFHGRFAQAFKEMDQLVSTAFHQLLGIVQDIGRDILSVFGLTIARFNNDATRWANDIRGFFARIPGEIGHALASLPGILYNAGRSAISSLVSGLKSVPVVGTVIGIAQTIADHFPHSPAKLGPLSGQGDPLLLGQRIVQRLIKGMQGETPAVRAAASKLANTIKAAVSLSRSVTSAAISGFDITSITAPAGKQLNADIIRNDLRRDAGTIRKFTANVRKLAREGLSETLLRQIINAGPVQGGEYAQALADANLSQIHSINKQERELTNAAGYLGRQSAGALYGSRLRSEGRNYLIRVEMSPAADQAKIGREIVNAIRAFERGSGSRWRAA
jgi:hypothetical protein